jgi:hypothetical protein
MVLPATVFYHRGIAQHSFLHGKRTERNYRLKIKKDIQVKKKEYLLLFI